eukprot:3393387-Amphidinium_carterae.1
MPAATCKQNAATGHKSLELPYQLNAILFVSGRLYSKRSYAVLQDLYESASQHEMTSDGVDIPAVGARKCVKC